jgi:hypothetical protein
MKSDEDKEHIMNWYRAYALEICWLALLIAIVLLVPARRSSAMGLSWFDSAIDCSSEEGWCVPNNLPVIDWLGIE